MGYLTWNPLLDLPPTRHDLAWLNLKSAADLPCAISPKADECLQTLEKWVEFIRLGTEEAFRRTRHKYPNDTDAEFRMLVLASFVQRHLGVRYNQAFMKGEYDGRDACNLFLHGVLNGRGGTCVTLPVLYTAIGRRLGYPLRLAHAKPHMFCRWDDPSGERFNIEAACYGYGQHDDSYYREWPLPIRNHEIEEYGYIRSLMPHEEAAFFVALRGKCYLEHLEFAKAVASLHQAFKWHPAFPQYHLLWGTSLILYRVFGDRATDLDELDPDAITEHELGVLSEFEPGRLEWARADLQRIVMNWRTRPAFPPPDLSVPHLTAKGSTDV